MDAVSVSLLIQEVKHVFNCERQSGAPTHSAEQGLKQVVHKLLQRALKTAAWRKKWKDLNAEPICEAHPPPHFIHIYLITNVQVSSQRPPH